MAETITMRKMVLIVTVSCVVTAICICLVLGILVANDPRWQAVKDMPTTSEEILKKVEVQRGKAEVLIAKAEAQKDIAIAKAREQAFKEMASKSNTIKLTTTITHRFKEGDIIRHISGVSDFDLKVTRIYKHLQNDGTVKVSYYLVRPEHYVSFFALIDEDVDARFIDACYNRIGEDQ